jgi:hypothetical protein
MACPESSSGIFRRAPGKETEEDTMSITYGRYDRMAFQFCTDGVEFSAHSKPRSAASMPSIAAKAFGKPATPNSEARLTRKKGFR